MHFLIWEIGKNLNMIFAIKVILKLCYDICNKLEELSE